MKNHTISRTKHRCSARWSGDPVYPVPRPENAEQYRKYKAPADITPAVRFVGRLATYKYYTMDQVVGQALALFDKLRGALPMNGTNDGESD